MVFPLSLSWGAEHLQSLPITLLDDSLHESLRLVVACVELNSFPGFRRGWSCSMCGVEPFPPV